MKASKYKMDSEFRMEIDRQIRHTITIFMKFIFRIWVPMSTL